MIDYHECVTKYHRFLCFSIGQIDGLLFKKIHRGIRNVSPIPILAVIVKDDQTNNFQQTKSFNLEFMTDHKKRNDGNGIAVGAALGLLLALVYGNKSGIALMPIKRNASAL